MAEWGYSLLNGQVAIKSPPSHLAVHWQGSGNASSVPVSSPAGAGHVAALRRSMSASNALLQAGGRSGGQPNSAGRPGSASAVVSAATASRLPAARADAIKLCAWLQEELVRTEDGDDEAKLGVWDRTVSEIARQVGVQCAERGRLLELARLQYLSHITRLSARLATQPPTRSASPTPAAAASPVPTSSRRMSRSGSPALGSPAALTSISIDSLDGLSSLLLDEPPSSPLPPPNAAPQPTPGPGGSDAPARPGSSPGRATDRRAAARRLVPGIIEPVGGGPSPSRRPRARAPPLAAPSGPLTPVALAPGPLPSRPLQRTPREAAEAATLSLAAKIERSVNELVGQQLCMLVPPVQPAGRGAAASSSSSTRQAHAGLPPRAPNGRQFGATSAGICGAVGPAGGGAAVGAEAGAGLGARGGVGAGVASKAHRLEAAGGAIACVSSSTPAAAPPQIGGSAGGGIGGGGSGGGGIGNGGVGGGELWGAADSTACLSSVSIAESATAAGAHSHDASTDAWRDPPRDTRPAAVETTERVQRLLEEAREWTAAERAAACTGLGERAEPARSRVEAAHEALARLTARERATVLEGAFETILAGSPPAELRQALVRGFGALLSEEQEHTLSALMRTVPPFRRADALLALLEGTSVDDEIGGALAGALMHVGRSARRRAFQSLAQHAELYSDERRWLAGVLASHNPGMRESAAQTDLSWAAADERMADAQFAAAAEEAAHVAEWEWRASRRLIAHQEALIRLDEARGYTELGVEPTPFIYRDTFGVSRPKPSLLSLDELLPQLSVLIETLLRADTSHESQAQRPVPNVATFLCERIAAADAAVAGRAVDAGKVDAKSAGAGGGGASTRPALSSPPLSSYRSAVCTNRAQLSNILHSIRVHAVDSQRANLFALAASLQPPYDAGGATPPILSALATAYGGVECLRRWLPSPEVYVMLTREAADEMRVHAPLLPSRPADGPGAPRAPADAAEDDDEAPTPCVISWGSVEETLGACGLPLHLEHSALAQAERVAVALDEARNPGADGQRALEMETLLSIVAAAWRTLHRQRVAMLGELFDVADTDDDGILTVPQLWGALQRILRGMVQLGGDAESEAEPWLARGESELLYQQMVSETAYLRPDATAGGKLRVSRGAFIAVLMRRNLYDVDFGAYLERHPEQRAALL